MQLRFPLLLILGFVIMTSGCIHDPESIAMSHPIVKDFLEEYPNAQIQMTYYSEQQSSNIIEIIREDCENPYIEAKNYYKVTIEDDESGLSVLAWIDWDNKIVTCATKSVTSDDDTGGSGGGMPPVNDTNDGGSSGGGGGAPLPKYPDYLIEEDIGDFEFLEAYEVPPEYKINDDSGKGYRAKYSNFQEMKPECEHGSDYCSTENNTLVCYKDGNICNGREYYVEVWVYSSDDNLMETIENDMFEKKYREDDKYEILENQYVSVTLNNQKIISFSDGNYKERNYKTWTSQNIIVKIEDSPEALTDAYLEKLPSDFDLSIVCHDTDSGKDYFNKGFTAAFKSLGEGDLQFFDLRGSSDACYGEDRLYEKYCENGEVKTELVDCPGGCDTDKERCIELKEPPTVEIDTPPDGFFGTEPEGILRVYTNIDATCEMRQTVTSGSGGSPTNWKEMEETGETTHTEPLQFQDETTYKFEARCHNDYGTSDVVESNYEVRLPDPDYIVQEIIYEPESPTIGDILRFYGVIYNQGSGGLYVQEFMNMGCELIYPDGSKNGGGGMDGARIPPGESSDTGKCGFPLNEEGVHTLVIIADVDDWITEEDEDNNELSLNVTVTS